MPYNNTPITPAKEITGAVSLPLARVKKIIATDDEISNCSNNAAFVITVAAEMFLQHLVEQSYNIVESSSEGGGGSRSGKVRKNIQYRDVANAVSRVENLEFLTDVVPKTTTYRTFKAKQTSTTTGAGAGVGQQQQQQPQPQQPSNGRPGLANGQSTLDTHMPAIVTGEQQATNGASPVVEVEALPDAMDVDAVDEEIQVDDDDDDDGGDEDGEDAATEASMHTANDEPVPLEGGGGTGRGGAVVMEEI